MSELPYGDTQRPWVCMLVTLKLCGPLQVALGRTGGSAVVKAETWPCACAQAPDGSVAARIRVTFAIDFVLI